MKFDITCVIIFARHRPHDVRTDIITPSVHDPSINKCKHRNSSFALHHVRCMLYSDVYTVAYVLREYWKLILMLLVIMNGLLKEMTMSLHRHLKQIFILSK